jgi:hypothetical protein
LNAQSGSKSLTTFSADPHRTAMGHNFFFWVADRSTEKSSHFAGFERVLLLLRMMPRDRAKRLDDVLGWALFAYCAAIPANRNESYFFVDLMEGIFTDTMKPGRSPP